jgi:hypothetical protein
MTAQRSSWRYVGQDNKDLLEGAIKIEKMTTTLT